MTEVATTKLSSKGQIVIPVSMRRDFSVGEDLVIIKEGDDLIIKKQKKAAALVLADEKLLGEDWLSPEDEKAWKDL